MRSNSDLVAESVSLEPVDGYAERVSTADCADVCDEAPAPSSVAADRVARAFSALLDDARGRTTERRTFSICTRSVGGVVHATVRYYDVGASSDGPFARSPASRASSSRVAIAVAKTLVEAHGGTVVSENDDGAGTTFAFTLPATFDALAVAAR